MSKSPGVLKAGFSIRGREESFAVHFNPDSLQYTISNKMKNTGSGNSAKQYVDESTGKLSMELIFDTTDTGEDVRLHSGRVARLMEPGENDNVPPVVEFEWGVYSFAGVMEKYKETIDFFSSQGVPLRASINLTLASQDDVFEGGSTDDRATTRGSLAARGGEDRVMTSSPPDSDGRGVSKVAAQAGNAAAGRDIAAQNNLENMRFPGQAPLELKGSGSAAGVSSLAESSLDRGNSFQRLHTRAQTGPRGALKLDPFLQSPKTAQLGVDDGAGFSVTGQARLQGSASFKADVGQAGALKSRIEFDGDA